MRSTSPPVPLSRPGVGPGVGLVVVALLAGGALAEGEVYQWVDDKGQTHITTTPPPKGAKRPSSAKTAKLSYLYQWTNAAGRYHITSTPPPAGAKLIEKVQDPDRAPSPDERKTGAPAGVAPATSTARSDALTVDGLRSQKSVGARAPDIGGYNALGDEVALAEMRGQPVWVTFATKFCRHCGAEAKVMAALEDEMTDVHFITVLGVTGNIGVARKWAERYGLNPSGVIAGTPDVFAMGAVPHNVFIDRTGRVSSVVTGALSDEAARRRLQPLR